MATLVGCGLLRSLLKRPPARLGDPDSDHFYRRVVCTRYHLAFCRREAVVNEAGEQGAIELVGEDEQVLDDATRNAGEERQGTALFRAEV